MTSNVEPHVGQSTMAPFCNPVDRQGTSWSFAGGNVSELSDELLVPAFLKRFFRASPLQLISNPVWHGSGKQRAAAKDAQFGGHFTQVAYSILSPQTRTRFPTKFVERK